MAIGADLIEVFANRFRAIADEMAVSIQRTAFSVYVKETRDFAAGLSTSRGEVFGFPSVAPPMMIGSDASTVIASFGDLRPGDIVATNDPITSGAWMTHLNDVHLLKPVFMDGEPLFYLWAFLHLSDVGGRVPGSISASNLRLEDEGIRVPPRLLYRSGVLVPEVADAFRRDSRTPELNWGDINALVAAVNKGEERSLELIGRYGPESVTEGIDAVLAYGERKSRAVIAGLPNGEYAFTDYLETHNPKTPPVPISVRVEVNGSDLHLDFEGTGAQVQSAYNLVTFGKRHSDMTYGVVNFLRTADPSMPSNGGILRPLSVRAQPGSILNAEPGAAIGARMSVVVRTMEAVYGALSQASALLPVASGDRTLVFLSAPASDGTTRLSLLQPVVGGSGARETRDGIDGIDAAVAWLRNVPTEVLESEMPVVIRRYRLAAGYSAGRSRGGRGTEFEFTTLTDGSRVIARNRSRRDFRPWGREGGEPGGYSRVWLNPGTAREECFDLIDSLDLACGDTLRFVSGYGGSVGSPLERDPLSVCDDVITGMLTSAEALEDFSVVVAADGVSPNWDETNKARRAIRTDVDAPAFSRGVELLAYEAGVAADTTAKLSAFVRAQASWRRPAVEALMLETLRVASQSGSDHQSALERMLDQAQG